MQDFKSYTFERRSTLGHLFGRLILVVVLLALIAAGFLYLTSKPNDRGQPETPTAPQSPSQPDKKQIIPLSLPNQQRQQSEDLTSPSFRPDGVVKEITAPAPPIVENVVPKRITVMVATPIQENEASQKAAPPVPEIEKTIREITHKISKGDSLATIFKKHGLSANLLHRIIHSSDTAKQLTKIRPGETLQLELDDKGNFIKLRLVHNRISNLEISVSDSGFTAEVHNRKVESRNAHLSGTIESSLYLSAKKAGLSEKLIMQLADVFGWDIDFALEIRSGDRFTVIFEEIYLDGEKLHDGPILAAEFINQGRTYQTIRYTDETGHVDYYTPKGRSMRKAFLRAPVDFRRISSKFAKERWHPVLGIKRPHRGVDYAAKTGTPIKAAGDGKVVFRGKKGGYGNTIIIQHGQTYTTLYGHLSRFNKTAKTGRRLKQGQVIGYVGKTGLATGPHLHYEFRVNGVHRNPLTVKLPQAKPISKQYRDDFLIKSEPLISKLELISRTFVANAQ
jgi:murein DD-endopeptidase MepM/ murein hydrolase activator NlpD